MLALSLLTLLFAQETILLHKDAKPAPLGHPERFEDRGTGGVHDRSISDVSQPSLTVYLPPKGKGNGRAIVICPGGGYEHLAIDKEGHDVARWLASQGTAGLVLKYRLPGKENMTRARGELPEAVTAAKVALEDATRAMELARANAARWSVKPDAVGMMGFSAGGNLAALMGMTAPAPARPDFLVLVYPAIPKGLDVSHVPRTFLAHADDDHLSADDNSVRFYQALKKAGVSAELHVYASGGHGFGIKPSDKTASGWTADLATWLAHPVAPAPAAVAPAKKLKVLVVTGGHGFQAAPFFKMFDDDTGITYTAAKQDKAAEAYDRSDLYDYDAVVLYDSPSVITDAEKARLHGLIERGIGLVVLHHAFLSYQKWPEFERLVGAKYLLDDERVGDLVIPESTYTGNADISAKIVAKDHPVTAGLHDFTLHDELYHRMRMGQDITLLVATDAEPLAWARTEGKSRIVGTSLGHGPGSFSSPEFLQLLRQSIRFVARR
jgi:acetyl esterase/lipase/type 1 glutamine amidotransferase